MPEKHHYIPIFYQKRWASADGRVSTYSRPYKKVVHSRRNPEYVGYETDLYSVESKNHETASHLEHRFFMQGDDIAAHVLAIFEADPSVQMDVDTRSGWSRFIMSIINRAPDEVKKFSRVVADGIDSMMDLLRAEYERTRETANTETFESFSARTMPEYKSQMTATLLQSIMDSSRVGKHLNQMRWTILKPVSSYTFLTSDRPIIMTNGIARPDGHLAIPIGPRRLFVAANERTTIDGLLTLRSGDLIKAVNNLVVKQARRFVIGIDGSQLRFVENRFGAKIPSSPTEGINWAL
jgi:hypothetical protein